MRRVRLGAILCAQGRFAAHTFDTGWIEAKHLGLSTAKRYQFRRKTTCAPLVADGEHISMTISYRAPLTGFEPNGWWDFNYFDCFRDSISAQTPDTPAKILIRQVAFFRTQSAGCPDVNTDAKLAAASKHSIRATPKRTQEVPAVLHLLKLIPEEWSTSTPGMGTGTFQSFPYQLRYSTADI